MSKLKTILGIIILILELIASGIPEKVAIKEVASRNNVSVGDVERMFKKYRKKLDYVVIFIR